MAQVRVGFWKWIWPTRSCEVGKENTTATFPAFQCWKIWTCFFVWSNNSGVIDVKMDWSVLEELGLFFLSSNWIGALNLYLLLKLHLRKINTWFKLQISFLYVAPRLFKSFCWLKVTSQSLLQNTINWCIKVLFDIYQSCIWYIWYRPATLLKKRL